MRVAILNWRDLSHPEGGGAERYAQTISAGLAERGHEVTFFCAAHPGAPAVETLDGYRIVRRGGRAGVYPAALRALRRSARAHGDYDVVIDTQNGLPFWSPLATRTPVISLVHHVHREQWAVIFSAPVAKVGWLLESQVSPRVYRGRQYVTVSDPTRDELVELGVARDDIVVIHNGTDRPLGGGVGRADHPVLAVLGRLVPHKRVELAIDVLADLRPHYPGLELRVIGDGWWREAVAEHARDRGVEDSVHLLGYVDELTKHRELARAWVALAPSAKEGWGLNVLEAASHGVPTVAHEGAGGLSESIVDGETGVLARDHAEFVSATAQLLSNEQVRARLGANARHYSRRFTWEAAVQSWESLLLQVCGRSGETGEGEAGDDVIEAAEA